MQGINSYVFKLKAPAEEVWQYASIVRHLVSIHKVVEVNEMPPKIAVE